MISLCSDAALTASHTQTGTIVVNGRDISTLTNNELADDRASTVGFVFQFYNLIPMLTVQENVALVKKVSSNAPDAKEMIAEVGDIFLGFNAEWESPKTIMI